MKVVVVLVKKTIGPFFAQTPLLRSICGGGGKNEGEKLKNTVVSVSSQDDCSVCESESGRTVSFHSVLFSFLKNKICVFSLRRE